MKTLSLIFLALALSALAGGPRYYDVGDGNIIDRATGLMWLRDAGACGKMNWSNAVTFCNDLSTNGYDDWRLGSVTNQSSTNSGNVAELDALFKTNALPEGGWAGTNGTPFVNIGPYYYWSSVTVTDDEASAWVVDFEPDYAGQAFMIVKPTADVYVWPVRGPVAIPPFVLIIGGTGAGNIGGATNSMRGYVK